MRPSSFFGVRGVSFDDAPPASVSWGHGGKMRMKVHHAYLAVACALALGVRRRLSPMTRSAMSTARGRPAQEAASSPGPEAVLRCRARAIGRPRRGASR